MEEVFQSLTQLLPRKATCELDKLGNPEAQWALTMIHPSSSMMGNEMPRWDNSPRAHLEKTHLAVFLCRVNAV